MLVTKGQAGFTLIEIIAVLILLGVLAVIAVTKYMGLIDTANDKAVISQFAELSGRMKVVEASFLLENSQSPSNGQELLTFATVSFPATCPENSTVEGAFVFSCSGDNNTKEVVISISKFQQKVFSPAKTFVFSF